MRLIPTPEERERLLRAEDALMWEAVRALAQDDNIAPAAALVGITSEQDDS